MDTAETSSPPLTLKSTGHGSIPEAHGQHVPIMAAAEPHSGGRGNLRQWIEEAEGYPKIPWDKRYGVRLRSCHGLKFLSGEVREVLELRSQELQSMAPTLPLRVG